MSRYTFVPDIGLPPRTVTCRECGGKFEPGVCRHRKYPEKGWPFPICPYCDGTKDPKGFVTDRGPYAKAGKEKP